ncbi:MAG: hypothetical protein K2Q21_10540 [Chitinophagaceae bacterium]|nr:hypothetical protein [Chitinophagaceae bacterium]
MKKIISHFLIPAFLFGLVQKASAQKMDSVMTIYEEQFPKEKIHIHFDRTIYNKDETIFYKLYLMTGSDLSPLSRNVYVAWYDTSGNFIRQTAAPLYQSSAKGSFDIPANYKGDFIRVKAFTRWMLNDDSSFIYQKDIPINSGTFSKTKSAVAKTKVELFPESGVLVQGLNSRLAFKATNGSGLPVFIKGFLVNDKNKVVDTIKVAHDGMGLLNFKTIAGENYQLNWIDENAQKGSTPVPQALKSGVTLRVTMDNEKAYAQVERTSEVPDNYKYLRLLVHQNQHLIYTVEFKGEDRLIQKASLPIDELPTGVLQLSLFTKDWMPIAERIVFVNNRLHEYNAKLSVPLSNLSKRGKNVIEILVSDTAASNMSIAVTDASIVMPEQQNIYSDFLLSNEIRGKVYRPAYYFSSDADSVAAHLDLVMLTNGWRKFDWEKVKAGVVPVNKYPFESEFMKIAGKVYGSQANKVPPDLQLNLVIVAKDSSKKFLYMPVMKDGSFEEKSVFFFDTVRVFYGFNGSGNTRLTDQVQVQLQNGLLHQEFRKINLGSNGYQQGWSDSMARAKLNYYLLEQEKLRKQMESTTLQEVIVKSKVKSPTQVLEEKYATGLFSGGDGYSFDLSSDASSTGAMDVLSYLQGKVAGLTISGYGAQASVSWRGSTPDIFLNEMKMSIDMVQTIPVTNIAYIKVLRPPFFGSAGGGAGGAIAIYTKKGKSATSNTDNSKGMENTILGGYSVFKEFYSPNYDKPTGNFDADNRTTLYWNPYLLTNKRSPRVKIEFYNNDSSKKLQIVLEGVNSNGKLARVVKYIE